MENKPLCPQGREGGENCVCKATILQKQNKTNQLRWARSHIQHFPSMCYHRKES